MNEKLKHYRILLGSQSPRRQELLRLLGINFIPCLYPLDETVPPSLDPRLVPEFLAQYKAEQIINKGVLAPSDLLITADTVVLLHGKILGKPKSLQEASKMLHTLQGNKHEVITGVCLSSLEKVHSFSCSTTVCFGNLSTEQIEYYVQEYKPLDKAGAYGIQEWIGGIAISRIEGSFYNVMGLPIHRLYQELEAF
jgi:septum formation protein